MKWVFKRDCSSVFSFYDEIMGREGVAAGIALQLAWRLPWIYPKVIPGIPGLWWKHGMCITTILCTLSNSINPRTLAMPCGTGNESSQGMEKQLLNKE